MTAPSSPRDVARQNLKDALMERLYQEGCGICLKPGGKLFWFSPFSRLAHEKCVHKINASESELVQKITDVAENNFALFNMAHTEAIREVQQHCGEGSIDDYFDTHGEEAMKELFNNHGWKGAHRYMINWIQERQEKAFWKHLLSSTRHT